MSTNFPYRYKQIDFGKICDPLIKVQILTLDGWIPIWFLVDSGADTTTLPLQLAKILKCKVDKDKGIEISGVSKEDVKGYPGEIEIKIDSQVIKVRCYFVDNPQIIHLLGRLDIFDKFDICFENSIKLVKFSRYDHSNF